MKDQATTSDNSRLDYVPLSDIHYNPGINARRDTETDITELAATIDAQDIGQPLLLRPIANGYEPVDGGRRLRALKLLADQGKISPRHAVPAYIRFLDDSEARSLSLATAITRMDLHPADEALNFADLAADGLAPEEIAARFGIPLRRVKQRLAIGRLPAEIIGALKAGQIKLAACEAYTLLHDPVRALKLFKSGVKDDWSIRQEFGKARVASDTAQAKYVGRDAYVAAGGAIDEDLFSNNVWFADGKLLSKLFRDKLKADEKAWLADGWSFVIIEDSGYKTYGWPSLSPEGKRNLTKEQEARVDELRGEIKALEKIRQGDDENAADEADEKSAALDEELKQLITKEFTEAQRKKSGVAVRVQTYRVEVEFGVMKPAEAKKQARLSKQTADDDGDAPSAVRKIEPEAEADFTQGLAVEMARVMTHAMQHAVISKPSEAIRLAAAVLVTASNFLKPEGFIIPASHKRDAEIGAATAAALDDMMSNIAPHVSTPYVVEVFKGLLNGSMASEIAISLAQMLRITDSEMQDLRPIIDHFDPDVSAHWQPDEMFFKRMPRESLAAALTEANVAGGTPSKKKKELVEMAIRELPAKGWLPKPLRTPSYKGPGSNAWADAQGAAAVQQLQNAEVA